MSLNALVVLSGVAVFALPLAALGVVFSAKRLGDEKAGFYLAIIALVWCGFAGLGLTIAGR